MITLYKTITSSRLYHWPTIILNSCVMEYALVKNFYMGFVMGVALSLAASYGFIINDIKDVNTDRLNNVDRLQNLSPNQILFVKLFSILFSILSLSIASTIGSTAVGVTLFVLTGLTIYSFFIRKTIFANLLCALMCTSPLWSVYFIQSTKLNLLHLGIIITAFILTLVREIIFDIQDRRGDREDGRRSLPILIGLDKTRYIFLGLTIIGLMVLIVSATPLFLETNLINRISMIIFITIFSGLFTYPIISIYKEESKEAYIRFGIYTRWGMLILPIFLLISII